jgi:hypothetical protein
LGFAKDKQLLVPSRQRNMDEKVELPKGWFTDEQREKILRNIGTSLIAIQLVEHLIDTALLYVFRESPPTGSLTLMVSGLICAQTASSSLIGVR